MLAISREATSPTAAPMTALPATVSTNADRASIGLIATVTARIAIAKTTSPVPSLKTLSPSTRVTRPRGAPSRRNVSMTATGSVAATIAPTTNPSSGRSPVPTESTTATTLAATRTPGAARRATPPNALRRWVASIR